MKTKKEELLSSEMVGKGHPDKICDAIGDAILTESLKYDEDSRVAIETTGGKNIIFITGEITTKADINIDKITRETIKKCGYKKENIDIIVNVGKQSQDIARGVNKEDIGAGDQGIMYGYATNETDNYMPTEHYWATKLALFIDKNVIGEIFGSDFKTQVTIDKNKKIKTVLISIQHDEKMSIQEVRDSITKHVDNFKKEYGINYEFDLIINPTGRFVEGWFDADAGTTGRKIIVDNYGSRGRVGGGAFSGKDYTKVDRSAAYMCRFVAKNIVANNLAKICEIQVAYAIGIAEPVSINVETFGTNNVSLSYIYEVIEKNFSFKVSDIIERLQLKKTDYTKYSAYGHFGKEATWENVILL